MLTWGRLRRQDETVEVMTEIASCPTAVVEPRRRFEYWNDLVSKAVRGIHVVQPRLRLNSHLLIVVARIGLVPKQCSTGGKERLGGISK
jgi:hypothetical protein